MLKETNNEINQRIIELTAGGYTWYDTAAAIQDEFNVHLTTDAVRCRYHRYKSRLTNEQANPTPVDKVIDEQTSESDKLKMLRMQISDERTQNNALLRRIAREQTLIDIAHDAVNTLANKYPFDITKRVTKADGAKSKEAILQISDWHYGTDFTTALNTYNTDIAVERVIKLAKETILRLQATDTSVLHVVNLGDMISGRIHYRLRINSRIDVITQTIQVSELIARFLDELMGVGIKIHYYDTLDNHSRLEPIKENSIDLESLARITGWFLRERMQGVTFHTLELSNDIATVEILGHKIGCVHGDKDTPETVAKNMSVMYKTFFDMFLIAHRHHFAANELNSIPTICNGSLMGTDDYAYNLRVSARPTQNLIIVTEENVLDTLYCIDLS